MMKTLQLLSLVFVSSLFPGCISSRHSKEWLESPPPGWSATEKLNASSVFEIVHTKVSYALNVVSSSPAVAMNSRQVEFLCGRKIEAQQGHRFYLVRSQFGNGSTGTYVVCRDSNDEILISHESLGGQFTVKQSALVLILKNMPRHVYSSLSMAK